MDNSFSFKNRRLELLIDGVKYCIDVGDISIVQKTQDLAGSIIAQSKNMEQVGEPCAAISGICEFIGARLDEILGVGAYAAIFKGREASLPDHIDLVNFLVQKTAEARAQMFTQYSPTRLARKKAQKSVRDEVKSGEHIN